MCSFETFLCFQKIYIKHIKSIFSAGVLNGIFTQVHGEDDGVREKAIKFLFANLRKLPEDSLNKESQDYIVEECKKVKTLCFCLRSVVMATL